MYTVTGSVLNIETKSEINGVSIDIYNLNDSTLVKTVSTNRLGDFVVQIPNGQYTFVLTHRDYNEYRTNITLNGNQTVFSMEPFYLTPKSYNEIINGSIKDEKNQVVSGVIVDVFKSNNTAVTSVTSDKNGSFNLPLKYGEYNVKFTKEGYTTRTISISVSEGYPVPSLNVILEGLGEGSINNPYKISSITDLQNVRNDLSAYYIMVNDIDASGFNWSPIGNSAQPFTGCFDGNGYTIKNIKYSRTGSLVGDFGLFGCNKGIIKNINLDNVTIEGFPYDSIQDWYTCYLGGVAGRNLGEIINCQVRSGVIQTWISHNGIASFYSGGRVVVGGICGENYGKISKCLNNAKIDINSNYYACAGGIAGNSSGEISYCFNKASVYTYTQIGSGGFRLPWAQDAYSYGIASGGKIINCLCSAKEIKANVALQTDTRILEILHSSTSASYIGGDHKYTNYAYKDSYVLCGKAYYYLKDEIIKSENNVTLTDLQSLENKWNSFQAK